MRPSTTLHSTCLFLLFFLYEVTAAKNRCYSCASSNMQQDFLNRKRGPQKRIAQPKMFDNFCDLDVWIIKQRSSVDCDGACFKWQQIVNNSGSFSYMTLRSCYSSMFDLDDADARAEPRESYCSSTSMALECLPEANVLEHSCWCQGDYCNGALMILPSLFSNFVIFNLQLVLR